MARAVCGICQMSACSVHTFCKARQFGADFKLPVARELRIDLEANLFVDKNQIEQDARCRPASAINWETLSTRQLSVLISRPFAIDRCSPRHVATKAPALKKSLGRARLGRARGPSGLFQSRSEATRRRGRSECSSATGRGVVRSRPTAGGTRCRRRS